eukprot:15463404-Alexandrium_andersonii.AAC.1
MQRAKAARRQVRAEGQRRAGRRASDRHGAAKAWTHMLRRARGMRDSAAHSGGSHGRPAQHA